MYHNDLEMLSEEYKAERSDMTDEKHRNDVLYGYMLNMEDCQLKVAIYEHLKAVNYHHITKRK